MDVGCQHHTQAALPTEKSPQYPLYRSLGVPLSQCVQVQRISPPPQFELENVQPTASRYTNYIILAANTPKILNEY